MKHYIETDFKVFFGFILTTISYVVSEITLSMISTIVYILVGVSAFIYNVYNIRAKRAEEKRNKEKKDGKL
jgi:uncharacterized membrane protein YuzA (DUF378 family)